MILKDEAISVAIQCLRDSGVSYDEIGLVRYRTIAELDANTERRFDELREDDPRPNDDPSNVAEKRAFIDAMKADHRPHWSIAFMGFSDPEHRLLETYSIVRVFDDGHTKLSIIPVPNANGPQSESTNTT